MQPGSDFATLLDRALVSSGMPLAALRRRLQAEGHRISLSTLSMWRSGKRHPGRTTSLDAVACIERVLGLATGELQESIGPTRRTGPTGAEGDPTGDVETVAAIHEVSELLGFTGPTRARLHTVSVVADLDSRRRIARKVTRVHGQVVRGTVRDMLALEIVDRAAPSRPEFSAIAGGTIGRTAHHTNRRVFGGQLVLDREVTAPDTFTVEWAVDYPADYPEDTSLGFGTELPCREILLWARFASEDSIPSWIEELVETSEGVASEVKEPAGRTHALRRSNFGPGRLLLEWAPGDRD